MGQTQVRQPHAIKQQQQQQPNNQQDNLQEQNNNQVTKNQCFFYLGDTQNGKKLLDIFEGMHYSIFITVITVITLFADDFRIIFFTADQDQSFSYLNLICMFFFFVQIMVFCFVKEGYVNSFLFWLDIISTLTMILDLTWISSLIYGGGGSSVKSAASVAKIARASRASKIGAKATKLIRIIRLIRFLKLYKTASKRLEKQSKEEQKKRIIQKQIPSKNSKLSANFIQNRQANKRWTRIKNQSSCHNISSNNNQVSIMNLVNGSSNKGLGIPHNSQNKQDCIIQSNKKIGSVGKKRHTQNIKDLAGFQSLFKDFYVSGSKNSSSSHNVGQSLSQIQVPNQTKVGNLVKNQIQKNLIIMILFLIISIPLFNASTWFDNLTSYEKGMLQLEYASAINYQTYDLMVQNYIAFMQNTPATLLYLQINVNSTCCTFPDNYPDYQILYNIQSSETYRAEDLISFSTDAGSVVVFQSSKNAILTAQLNIGRTIFVCLILIVSTLLFSRDVEVYALQPLQNMFEIVKKIALNPLNAIRQIQEKNMCIQNIEQQFKQQQEQTQPNLLQNLIVKIGGLLAVGFGQAGTQIISKVIQDPNFVNVIIPGQKVIGIYGFCDIRNFTDATQILQADVMVFVNQIAQICHKIVNSHGGSPNKNIGDAFLLVWKYKQGDMKFLQADEGELKKLELAQTKRVKQLADLAVLSFVRMIADISKSYTLLKYKNNKALKNRIKDYKGVKMGFGLHVGWSIEGPIGSQFKVDASYLSPSVNMASRLEAGTKQYGVPMLITQNVYNLMTQNKKYLRRVDRVMFDGYDAPTDLYTVDLHIQSLLNHTGIQKQKQLTPKERKYKKIRENIKRNKLLQDIQLKYVTKDMWLEDDIKHLRQKYTKRFYQQWNKGFNNYISGNWQDAIQSFKKCQLIAPDQIDGPSNTLITFMEKYEGKAPEDWKGYREAVC